MSSVCTAVYQAICYFDIFNYPLKFSEIHKYCPGEINEQNLQAALEELEVSGKIISAEGYYFLPGKTVESINARRNCEMYLQSKMSTIKRYARFVNSFPFVEATFISGSVSKGVLARDGDVDYFIIARSGRVWICRTLLILFKKIFLFNSKKYFCVNYFVAENNLLVPDNNLFVATEIKTLVPVVENIISRKFRLVNKWAYEMFPNDVTENTALLKFEEKRAVFARGIERVCKGSFGERLDNFFFKKTLARWRKKFPHFNEGQFDLEMRSYKSVSKHHPQGNQGRVLTELALRMEKF